MNCDRCGRSQRVMHDLDGELVCCPCYDRCKSGWWWGYGQCAKVRDADQMARDLQLDGFLPAPEDDR